MSVARLKKVNILFPIALQDRMLKKLQDIGYVHLIEHVNVESEGLQPVGVSDVLSDVEYICAGILFAVNYLTPHEQRHGSILDKMLAGKPILSPRDVERVIKKTDYRQIIADVEDVESDTNKAHNTANTLRAELEELEPWLNLPFVINHQQMPDGFDFLLAVGVSGVCGAVERHLIDEGNLFDVGVVSGGHENEYFYVLFLKESASVVEHAVVGEGAEIVAVDDMETMVSDRRKRIMDELASLASKEESLVVKSKALATHLPELRIGYDYYSWRRDRINALSRAGSTSSVVVLSAWVEAAKLRTLEENLSSAHELTAVIELPFLEEEEPPVIMRNHAWAAPFESITGIYGSPSYNEPDPTPWLAPFFVIFFGLSLTDFGYGVFLTVLAALGRKFMAHTSEAKKLMTVMMVGGVSTAILGVLFGGWMGIVLDDLPTSGFRNLLIGIRLVDPITNPIAVLLLSFALGISQVMVGLFINLKYKFIHGDKKEALLGSGVWLIFLMALVLWVLGKVGVLPVSSLAFLTPLLLGATGLVVLSGMRKTKNWFLKLPVGVLGLYDVVGYFSDVLSYSRLLALGLGTGIIAMVVNLIARLAVDMVPVVGWILFALILIGGHLFNIAINVLGAYIHSSRLQFVEFFPKFMEGGGKVFQPFRKESKYINLQG